MQNFNNRVQLIGYLGKDVEVTDFPSGKTKGAVSLATSQSYKNKDGEYVSQTQWHSLVLWGKGAEAMKAQAQKGDLVIVDGSIIYRNYQDAQGVTKYVTEINVSQFQRYKTVGKSDN